MKIKINEHFLNVKESYLFSEIGRRVREYAAAHPDKKIIRLGIGDVTLPLTPTVIAAMRKATDEMGVQSTFRGYAPEYGYDFVRDAVKITTRRSASRSPATKFLSATAPRATWATSSTFSATTPC